MGLLDVQVVGEAAPGSTLGTCVVVCVSLPRRFINRPEQWLADGIVYFVDRISVTNQKARMTKGPAKKKKKGKTA